jgi:TonB-linked SusC/RagA family outer membrane protein
VLKDASATAVFGAKGANGVIIVTTKRGIQGKPQLNFSGSAGVENITDLPDHIDSHTTMSMWNVAKMNEQTFIELISDTALEEYRNPSSRLNSLIYPDVNWFDMCANSFAPTSNANLNIRGGNEFVRYFGSLGHTYQSDFFKNYSEEYLDSRYWYHRLNYRVNLDFNLTPSTLFSFNMGGDIGIKNQPSSSVWRNLYGAPTAMFPAYYPDWVLEEVPDPDYPDDSGVRLAQSFGSFHANPYSTIASGSFNRYITSTLFTDIIIDQKVDFILKGLSIKGKASLSTYYRNRSLGATYAYPQYMFYPDKIGVEGENPWLRENASDEVYVLPPVSLSAGGLESGYYRDMYYEGGINFNRSFGNHNATALLLVNREQKNVGTDFPYYNQGIVGRLTYDYKSKYLLEINVGYTGSERFSPKNRYGFFPSGAIGYVISEEDFFKSAVPWMNKLKLRYSEGLVGSDIAANRWLYISDFYIQNGYINEDKGANTTAQWEEAHKKDFGIEFGIFNNLFSGTIDLFDEQRDKMLLEPRTVTFIVGNTFKEINSGKFKKHGIEVELEFNKTTSRNFNYFVRTIVGWNENRVVFKDDLPYAYEYQKSAGKPIDVNFDGIEMSGTGYFTTVDDIQINPSATSLTNLVTGDYMYLDYNCDGIIDQKDKHPIEGSYYPPLTYSLTSGFSYKNFDFHVMFQGNEGKYVFYNYTFEWEFSKGDYRVHESQLDYWTPLNQTANHATLHDGYTSLMNVGWAGGSNDQGYTLGIPDRTWRDASYLRFKEIYLGYTLSSRFLQNVAGISNVQAYITGNNLFTWTPLIEGDPERKDFQYGFYPQMRNIKVGLSFSF